MLSPDLFSPSSLFLYKPLFAVELMLAVMLFSVSLKRKKYFFLRAAVGFLIIIAIDLTFPIVSYDGFGVSALFLCLFAVEIGFLFFCYNESRSNIFFCGIAGYAAQHLASAVYNLILSVTNLENMTLFGYGSVVQSLSSDVTVWSALSYLVYFDTYAFVYWLVYFLWGSKLREHEDLRLNRVSMLFLTSLVIIANIILNAFVVTHHNETPDRLYIISNHIYNILCCVLILYLQFGMVEVKKMHQEIVTVRELWQQQQKQYVLTKENIDLINMKCHDLKHQVRMIAQGNRMGRESIREIEKVISIYDTAVKTGNEALDIILTEKELVCNRNQIRVTCLADGEQLSFMKDVDIYTLFGNAMDNAIEAVTKIKELEKRVIGLKIVRNQGFLCIHLQNCTIDAPKMVDGEPVTSKADKENHGFGIRSMRQITERYGGIFSVKVEDGIFHLNITFPLMR